MLNTKGTITIRIPKRVDVLTAPHLSKDVQERIPVHGSVVLDLSQTQIVEPNYANVFLEALMIAKQRETRFSLRGVQPQVKVVLESAGVLRFFRKQ